MRPRKLTLKNVGPFVGELDIDFSSLDEIFLISGRTGSGKTTIFDALCFALYGSLPGSRRLYADRLRSDHAPPGELCSVTLDFALGSRAYRVERRPRQEQAKKRGEGTRAVDEQASFYELDGNRALPFTMKKSEIDAKIRELIGLSAEEFCKIVLLPQGEFARFLQQNTSERREVLGKLFPVDAALAIREKAADRVKELKTQLQEAEGALAALAPADTDFSARRAGAEAALKEADEQLQALRKKEAGLRLVLSFFQREEALRSSLDQVREEYRTLEKEGSLHQGREERLEKARAALPLQQEWLRTTEYKSALDNEKAALDRAEAALEKAAAAFRLLEEQGAAAEQTRAEILSLRDRRSVLVPLLAEEERFEAQSAALRELKDKIGRLCSGREEAARGLEDLEERLRKLEAQVLEGEAAEKGWEAARARLELLKEAVRIAKEAAFLEAETIPLREACGALEGSCAELEKNLPVLKEEYEHLERGKEAFEKSSAASRLALELHKGEPCPVCGSTEHPVPAAAAPRQFGIEERLPALKDAYVRAGQELASKRALASSKKDQLAGIGAREEKLQSEYSALCKNMGKDSAPGTMPELSRADAQLREQAAELTALSAVRDAGRRAASQLGQVRGERDALRDRIAGSEKELAVLETRKKALEEARDLSRSTYEDLIRVWEAPDVRSALDALDRRLLEKEKAAADYERQKEEAGLALAAAGAGAAAAKESHAQAELRHREALAAFNGRLKVSPFPDLEALEAASASEAELKSLEDIIRRYGEKKAELSALIKKLEADLDALIKEKEALPHGGTGAETEQELAALEGREAEAQENRDRAAEELAAAGRDEEQYRRALARREELALKTRRYKALSDDLSGNDKKKPAFDVWLLGRYLSEISAYATKRLEKMSEGRYALILDREGDGSRGKTGLDLAVFDAATGKSRPCGTLSGGETFMASISLALGLADSIQARSGGVRLDAVFIDEGFGSLDEASLDKALNILDELREHRMVGLISHVGELRLRIPSRIEIHKTPSGSRIALKTNT
jgi:exonuclease SbcC